MSVSTSPAMAVTVPGENGGILAAASTLSDQTDWSSEERSIATNYDYTQYVPPSCTEIYGSLALDSESVMLQPEGDRGVNDNGSEPYSAEETSIAGETFEAGPSSGLDLEERTSNAYYVVTDEYGDAEHAKALSGRKGLFRMVRLTGMKLGGKKKRNSTEASPIGDNSNQEIGKNVKQKSSKGGLFGRLIFNKNKSNHPLNDAPATPKAPAYVPSMLTPTTSPYSDNVTPSGLNAFNDNENSNDLSSNNVLLALPPKMLTSSNSISSMSIFASKGQDNASFTDVTHASDSDISPSNSPTRVNQELTPLIICNVVDDSSMSKVEEEDDSIVEEGDGNECDDEAKTLDVLQVVTSEGLIQNQGIMTDTNESKEAPSAMSKLDLTPSEKIEFVGPLVVENGDEFEMEYAGGQTTETVLEGKSQSTSTTFPEMPSIQQSRQIPRPTDEPLFLKVDSKESNEEESVAADENGQVNNVNSVASASVGRSATTSSETRPQAQKMEKRTMVKRLMSLRNNNCERSQGTRSSAEHPQTPQTKSTIVSEEEIATIQDYERLSPQYVIESQPKRDDNDGDSFAESPRKPIELAKMMLIKTKQGHKNSTSIDASLASDTGLEDGTVPHEESIIDNDGDRSESSFTFLSNDSTYFSEASDAGGCGIRRVLLQDLNDAVEDVREGVMDMVAAVRSTPIKKQGSERNV